MAPSVSPGTKSSHTPDGPRFLIAWVRPSHWLKSPTTLMRRAFAADYPPLGNFPDGVSGSTVFVGIDVPLTGTYADAAPAEQ